MMRVLVDTSAWLALDNAADQRHPVASYYWTELDAQSARFIISSWILEEVMTLVSRRAGAQRAYLLGRRFLDSSALEIIQGDIGLESRAMILMRQRNEKDFSFTDAMSWVIVREYSVDAVFAFDRHLMMPGIRQIPQGLGVAVREEGVPYQADPEKRKPTRRRRPAGGARHRSPR